MRSTASVSRPTVTVTTNASSYNLGTTITATYSGMPGSPDDWIALATQGSADTSAVAYLYTGGLCVRVLQVQMEATGRVPFGWSLSASLALWQ